MNMRLRAATVLSTCLFVFGCAKQEKPAEATATTPAAAAPEATAKADTGPIKVGILHSLSGTMAISETSLKDVALMTIE